MKQFGYKDLLGLNEFRFIKLLINSMEEDYVFYEYDINQVTGSFNAGPYLSKFHKVGFIEKVDQCKFKKKIDIPDFINSSNLSKPSTLMKLKMERL